MSNSSSNLSHSYQDYINTLKRQLKELYTISDGVRAKGLDPSLKTECIEAQDIADLVEGLVGPTGVALSIRKLSGQMSREEVAFKVAQEIARGNFTSIGQEQTPENLAEQAIRTALAIFTEGLTAAPIQGIAHVKIKKNADSSSYLAIYFAGPIRSAGGTDQALTLVVGDYVRRELGLDVYKPTEEEISRFIEELRLYERSVGRFQYHIPDEELNKALTLVPVECTGTESDPVEISSYRNLERVETNRVRGGALRVINDGIVGRAQKVHVIIDKLGFQGWDWLKQFKKKSEKKTGGFMDDVIAGRPIFAFPSTRGGFRLRYGRSRNTGLSAVGIHPVTMFVVEGFLAAGTQMRLELPGKGGVTMPVDSLEGPVVLLKDNSVVRVSLENFSTVKGKIERILFLGDILIDFGDFLYCNKSLLPSGYVEEWWVKDLKNVVMIKFGGDIQKAAGVCGFSVSEFEAFLCDPFKNKPTVKQASILSKHLGVPLAPNCTLFWSNLSSTQEVICLRDWLFSSELIVDGGGAFLCGIMGVASVEVVSLLRKILLPHCVVGDRIIIEGEDAAVFGFSLGYSGAGGGSLLKDFGSVGSVLDLLSVFCGVQIRDKAPSFVGGRMGRPEKAKHRDMRPLVHVLFPVGLAGGVHRDFVEASRRGPVSVDVVKRKCPNCGFFTLKIFCSDCGCDTVVEHSCPRCGKSLRGNYCGVCKSKSVLYSRQAVNFKEMINSACSSLGVSVPKMLRGVKGLTNEDKVPEFLEKGVLRAKYNVSTYKDGTIRFDGTNAPLTHITPLEIGVSVEKLRSLGYGCDIYGNELTDSNQVLELKIQDVVIPWKAGEYFIRISRFIDDLLERVYGLPRFYSINVTEDLVGQLIFGLAPHTCACILGRVIGYTDRNLIYAHPIWHSAKRRDCDGDEDAIMLALDTLINFSKKYLPDQIGGIMDAPLLMIPFVNTKEVQRQAHDFDVSATYPIEFYEKSWQKAEARQISPIMDTINHRLNTEAQFEGFRFTVPATNINLGNAQSSYKDLKTMVDKLNMQLKLGEQLEAVDAKRVALKVINTHFMRDIAGNLRAFSTQSFRCKKCNKKFRRLPLTGKCSFCDGSLTLTVYRGNIEKYLTVAQDLVDNYGLPKYYTQRLALIKEELFLMFDNKKAKQTTLFDFGS
ncbi:MAG: DNA polymerase II large subunit [Candidatus Bathyarchaeota archaeon]|nr:DNA polymerase II large subunit [Candidatus Termiticorpusculum sp.]MCL2868574.1 DNA polymerase II large subunit [Candidatus Termiticorpusculum sp.]